MEVEDEGLKVGKSVLRPRKAGETIKVAETVLKRRDRNLKANAERAAKIAKNRKAASDFKKGKLALVRAEKLVKKRRGISMDMRRLKHAHKKPLPKKLQRGEVLAVVRNGREAGCRDARIILRSFELTKEHSLVFKPNTTEIREKLRTLKPFVFWGVPSFQMVFDLVHKKALFKDPESKEKLPLSDNSKIEEHLGDIGVLCTEDLAQIIHTVPSNFEKVTDRLWPFALGDLRKAKGLARDKKHTFGDVGQNVSDRISQLIGT